MFSKPASGESMDRDDIFRATTSITTSFETVPPDRKGIGEVTINDFFTPHSALRMRPDRIIIGEVRRGAALDLIQTLTSGRKGSMSTLHANFARDALSRLETMALMSGVEMPMQALRAQVVSAIDSSAQLARLSGRRMVMEIAEVSRRSAVPSSR
ncbi:MAG: Flp pilus assembly complex ATPase component TadA [Bryobacterales bacterium]|nr:Flp pilus assembly complex ATPase component TadA [Bryobacterales bacterium]